MLGTSLLIMVPLSMQRDMASLALRMEDEKHVLCIGDIRGDAIREGIGKVVERDDTKVSYTSLNPTFAEKGHRTAVKSYAFRMSNARFCLIPTGDSPTSRRFFDSIVTGCLPIVISDDLDSSFALFRCYPLRCILVSCCGIRLD